MARLILFVLSCIFLSGCIVSPYSKYSEHNLDDGPNFFGGGFRITKVERGVYQIYAITNQAKLLNRNAQAEARQMWRDQAMKVCGYDYIEKDVKEYEVVRDNLFLQDSDDYQNVKYGTAHCLGSANVTSEDTATLLTPDKLDLRSLFSGNTRSGETKSKTRFHTYQAADGTLIGRATNKTNTEFKDSGTWEVTDEGHYCQTWKRWLEHQRICYRVTSLGNNHYELKTIGESSKHIVVIREGDPEGLIEGSTVLTNQSLSSVDVTGIYMSETITGDSKRRLGGIGVKVILLQTGKNISGTVGDSQGEIWGEVNGSTIKFEWATTGGYMGSGEWVANTDSSGLQGSWTTSTRNHGGVWNLKKIELVN